MARKAGKTINSKGKLIQVWECESCGERSISKARIIEHEKNHEEYKEFLQEQAECGTL